MGSTGVSAATGMNDPCVQSGDLSLCLTAAEFEAATGLFFPSACNPEGGTGCVNDSGTLAHPCCLGLVCATRGKCGGIGVGGSCIRP